VNDGLVKVSEVEEIREWRSMKPEVSARQDSVDDGLSRIAVKLCQAVK